MPEPKAPLPPPLVVIAGRRLARATAQGVRWAAPHLRRAMTVGGGWLWRMGRAGAIASGRSAHAHRGLVVDLAVRIGWCAALWLGLRATLDVLDTSSAIDVEGAMARFGLGLALCAAVTALARARRLRWGAISLGTAHGTALLLLHSLANP